MTDQGPLSLGPKYRLHVTAAGRRLYQREWARYRALPEPYVVDTIEPTRHLVRSGG